MSPSLSARQRRSALSMRPRTVPSVSAPSGTRDASASRASYRAGNLSFISLKDSPSHTPMTCSSSPGTTRGAGQSGSAVSLARERELQNTVSTFDSSGTKGSSAACSLPMRLSGRSVSPPTHQRSPKGMSGIAWRMRYSVRLTARHRRIRRRARPPRAAGGRQSARSSRPGVSLFRSAGSRRRSRRPGCAQAAGNAAGSRARG